MNGSGIDLQAAWDGLRAGAAEVPAVVYAIAADVVLTLAVLAAVLLAYDRLRQRQRRLEEAATAAQRELVERLEKVTERLEKRLVDAADKLDRDIAVIGEDAREARRIGRSIPAQLERIQAGLSAAQDELLHQSAAKFQANEAIRNAIARPAKPPDSPPPPAARPRAQEKGG